MAVANAGKQEQYRGAPELAQPLIDRIEQIFSFLFLQDDVCFPNHAEEMSVDHIPAGKELHEVQANDVLEQRKGEPAFRVSAGGTATNRGSTSGTLTRANRVRPSLSTTTARFLRFEI